MATASSPEGRGWLKPLASPEGASWEMEGTTSGILFRAGLILCLPHTSHRTGLVLSLFLCPKTLAIQEEVWKLLGGEGGRAIL